MRARPLGGISEYTAAYCKSFVLICSVNHDGNAVKLHFFARLYQMLCWLHVVKVIQFAKLNDNLVYKKGDGTTLIAIEC